MKIHGEFVNEKQRVVGVTITSTTGNKDIEIDGEGSGVHFSADDTVITESGFNDSLDVILAHSASVKLSTEQYISELFAKGSHDVKVEITLDGDCVFSGFVEPNTYSQDYVNSEDDLDINCVDSLSAMQYTMFRKVGNGTTYEEACVAAKSATFWDLLREALEAGAGSLDGYNVLYDGSRSLPGKAASTVFTDLSASELAFLGDEEDDVWTYQDVAEALLKYLNLHIVQEGKTFFIFSWEGVRKGNISWIKLYGTADASYPATADTLVMSESNVEDDGTQIDVCDAYNKLVLTVSPKSVDELVSSPLDDLDSAYPHRMRYCTEYRAANLDEFKAFLRKGADPETMLTLGTIKDAYWQDWYVLVKSNSDWLIGRAGNDMVDKYKTDDGCQENIVNQLACYPGAALVSIGRVQYNAKSDGKDKEDNSPTSTLDMSDYLVISTYEADSGDSTYDPLVTPLAEYVGSNGGAVFSPPDSKTINYIVITGTIRLEKKYIQSVRVKDYIDAPIGMEREAVANGLIEAGELLGAETGTPDIHFDKIKSEGHADCYMIYRWYKNNSSTERSFGNLTQDDLNPQNVNMHPYNWPSEVKGFYSNGLRMPSEFDSPDFEFEYSGIKDKTDRLSKVPVLECMLVIGDKVLVEDMDRNGNINALKWKKYKNMDACKADHPNDTTAAEDEYYSQTFSIGFDPKIGDHLLNEDHDVQTNFSWELGIDTDKGMAIPIQYSDHLHGKVDFRILGVVNSFYYNKITKRHRTWFRKEKWHEEAIPLMANVRNIFIKDFSIKLYSDNSMAGNEGDNNGDIVYMSDTDESFYNKKDDLEFKIHSAFTTEECAAQGISPVISLTTVSETASGDGCLQITDNVTGDTGKAEAEYVNEYYDEMHLPRITMTQQMQDRNGFVSPWRHYRSVAMGKNFYVQSIERNLLEGSAELTMKEIW